jgi:hypothetical protein
MCGPMGAVPHPVDTCGGYKLSGAEPFCGKSGFGHSPHLCNAADAPIRCREMLERGIPKPYTEDARPYRSTSSAVLTRYWDKKLIWPADKE